MKIGGVDFSEPLISAQQQGSLVIFAGAGVSMGPPSNYPSFEGLADEIARWAGKKRPKGDPLEHFLGRLEVNVHGKVVKLLSSPDSKPKTLHSDLLKLFGKQDRVRVVTTNFDSHFETAAEEIFGRQPEKFIAPALPLGDDFTGIVYLHGSVTADPKRLVLTDQDFGRAYLTKGWATRFLLEMFSKYTVLFVGYSHDDTVMHYLSRGLPPENTKPRFALVRADDELNEWRYRGIEPLPYMFEGNDDYSQLGPAVSGWVEWVNRGALDTEQRIKSLVSGPPPLDEESNDILKWAVGDPVAVRFFARHAKSLEWLFWASEQKFLEPLFSQVHLSDNARELALWVAENYVVQQADATLIVLERFGKALNPWFGYEIARRLAYSEPRPEGGIISKWVPILLQNKSFGDRFEFTEILKRALDQGEYAAVIQLFEYLTRPNLKIKKGISWDRDESEKGQKVDAELDFYGNHDLLSEVWGKNIKPILAELASRLWPVVVQSLNHAYQLSNSWGNAESTWDPLSWHRSAIEPHDQDQYPDTEDVLIDAARDCLEWALQNAPQVGHAWAESLSVMKPILLRRLAVHGVSFSPDLTANDKISWLLDRDFLFTSGLRHEVFQLLRGAYPGISSSVKEVLLKTITRKIDAFPEEGEEDRGRKEHKKFNLFFWLSQADPTCQDVAKQLALIKESYPDFSPGEFPDLDHWSSGGTWAGPRSPVSVEDLLKKRPTEWLEFFMTFEGERFEGPDRNSLLQIIGEAVQQDFVWGEEFAGLLITRADPTSDLWESVIRGWKGANLSPEQWDYVLATLDNEGLAQKHSHYLSDLLKGGAEKEEAGIPIRLLGKADSLAQKIWVTLQGERDEEPNDWLGRALNHPGGNLALFWLHAISRTRKETEEKEKSLPQPYRERFAAIISGSNEASALGRVILTSQLGFLFAVDQDWATANIVPLLDWEQDIQQARQAWDGWLSWGRLSEPLLRELIPLFRKSFPHLSSELQKERDRFVEWVVVISIFWMDDPLKNDWVTDFLQTVEDQDRVNFASQIGNRLISMEMGIKKGLWDRWLKRYWEGRNQGVPVPLSNGEIKEMVEWAGELEPVFPEVVEVVCEGRVPQFEHTSLFWRLEKKESNISNRYPGDLARLLVHLTTGVQMPRYFCATLEKLTDQIITAAAPAPLLLQLCDNLAAIGCVNAGELQQKVR